MHRQIPHHIDVVLEQSQIYPNRIVIVDVPECTRDHEVAHLADRTGVRECMVHEQHAVLPLRLLDELAGLRGGASTDGSRISSLASVVVLIDG